MKPNNVVPWPHASAPGLSHPIPQDVARAMKQALKAVDQDIERLGALTEATINQCRVVLMLAKTLG